MNRSRSQVGQLAASLVAIGALFFSGSLLAQNVGLTRTVVTKADVSTANHEAVLTKTDIATGGSVGWHTHPGDEISYVMEGDVELSVAGRPPRTLKPGEGFVIPAGAVHAARNAGSGNVALSSVYYVEKGKPLATPAPTPAP